MCVSFLSCLVFIVFNVFSFCLFCLFSLLFLSLLCFALLFFLLVCLSVCLSVCFSHSLTHSLTRSLAHSLTHSLSLSLFLSFSFSLSLSLSLKAWDHLYQHSTMHTILQARRSPRDDLYKLSLLVWHSLVGVTSDDENRFQPVQVDFPHWAKLRLCGPHATNAGFTQHINIDSEALLVVLQPPALLLHPNRQPTSAADHSGVQHII